MTATCESNPVFTQAQLDTLKGLRFKRRSLQRLLEDSADLEDGFWRYLLGYEYAFSLTFDEVMRAHNGDPSFVEYKHESRVSWAFVAPDVSDPGKTRVQYFDVHGFVSHHPYETLEQAVDALVTEGFVSRDDGALDRVGQLDSWRRGTEAAGLIQRLNARDITFEQYREMLAAL